MKRIVNGLTYNTETAQELARIWNGIGDGELQGYREVLFRTKKGNLFLYTSGGAMTSMRVSCGSNNFSGSAKIESMSEAEATKWYLDNNDEVSINTDDITESEFHQMIGYREILA